ncbi:MAG: hypothetical protein RJB66_1300 [Pseudomonadota bacterium]|jgi:multidrug transporter EmrE-like cation transporter
MRFWTLVLLGALLEVVGDVFLKKQQLGLGLGIYFLGSCFWAMTLKESDLSKSIIVFTVVNLLLVVAVGVIKFNEVLTVKQMIGVGFALVSLILI